MHPDEPEARTAEYDPCRTVGRSSELLEGPPCGEPSCVLDPGSRIRTGTSPMDSRAFYPLSYPRGRIPRFAQRVPDHKMSRSDVSPRLGTRDVAQASAFAPGLGSDLENRDTGRQRCEPAQVTTIAGQHDVTASGGTCDDRRVNNVGDSCLGAELACCFGEPLVEWIYHACVDHARKANLLRIAPCLGECWRRNHRNDSPRNGLSPMGPEPAVVSVGSDQRASVECQSDQRDLTRSRSRSVIGPCSASHSSSSSRAASSFRRCSTAAATNAESD